MCPVISVIIVNKADKAPYPQGLTFWWWGTHKQTWGHQNGNVLRRNKAEDGRNEHQEEGGCHFKPNGQIISTETKKGEETVNSMTQSRIMFLGFKAQP